MTGFFIFVIKLDKELKSRIGKREPPEGELIRRI